MASPIWYESSLRRSSELGLEVFRRARRRSADWWRTRTISSYDEGSEVQEDLSDHSRLDHAFAKIVEYMSETTNQCKRFYESEARAELGKQEKNHVCRFHSQHLPQTSGPTPPTGFSKRAHDTVSPAHTDLGLSEPDDILIDVSPGTYAVTATMHDTGPQTQTKIVHVNAGESMRLRFNL